MDLAAVVLIAAILVTLWVLPGGEHL